MMSTHHSAAQARTAYLNASGDHADLIKRDFDHRRTTGGFEWPAANPATVMFAINSDHLIRVVVEIQIDAITLMNGHWVLQIAQQAALSDWSFGEVRHEPLVAQIGESRSPKEGMLTF